MAEELIASLLAFFVGIYLWKRRWDNKIQEEDCEEPTEQRMVRTGAWSDTILVDTRTGKHFFALEYLRSHSKQELFHELAYGNIVHDEKWDGKIKIRKWDDTEWHVPTVDYLGIEDKETEA